MLPTISTQQRAQAELELRQRLLTRQNTSFPDWLPQVTPKYTWTWPHLQVIFKALKDIADGKIKRLMIFQPPRSGKSECVTVRFPAWMIERNPELRFIVAAYNVSLASKFSRKTQRIVSSRGITLDREAVDDWTTKQEGGVRAVGVGSGVTGHGANGILIDDPIKSKEEAYSVVYRDKAWEWYKDDLYTRLEPEGFIVLTLCMTGDTKVLMADGSEKLLVNINIGDEIATYEDGKLTTSVVRNWKNQGHDNTLTIALASGITVRANKRHPFLVSRNGGTEWIRLKDLVLGDKIARVVARTKESNVQLRDAKNLQNVEGNAHHITTRRCGQVDIEHPVLTKKIEESYAYVEDMESNTLTTKQSFPSKKANVLFVGCPHQLKIPQSIGTMGMDDSVLTTTTTQEKSEDFCATSAISLLDMQEQKKFYPKPLNTYEITTDSVTEIYKSGYEEVFDIQIDRTENFIANGLISHNTRWHYDDLAGRILNSEGGKEWTVIKLPALAEIDDPIDRLEGEALCPDRFSRDDLLSIKSVMGSDFESLYQQNPVAVQGSIFKRDWWKYYSQAPDFIRVIQSWDTAFKTKAQNDPSCCQTWGVTNNGYYLIDRWIDRVTFPDLKKAAIQQYDKYHPDVVIVEDKASGQSLCQELIANTTIPMLPIKTDKDKIARANAITPICESGHVFLPEGAPWVVDYIDQMAIFPAGAHDEDPDVTSQALNYLSHGTKFFGDCRFEEEPPDE
jgi:predicted phage terminase large subunit-like protein